MTGRALLVGSIALVGCGRIGFDPLGVGDGPAGDAAPPLAVAWSRTFGTVDSEGAAGVRVAADDSLVVLATCGPDQVVFVDGVEPAGGGLLRVAYAGADGTRTSTWRSPAGRINGARLARAGDDLAVAASFSQAVNVGGADLTPLANSTDVLVAAYRVSTGHRYSLDLGGNGYDFSRDVAITPTGGACHTGSFLFPAAFGGAVLDNQGGDDAWVACYDVDGAHRWSAAFGGPGDDVGRGIAVDAAAAVYLAGSFTGTVSFGGPSLVAVGSTDIFVASFDADGTWRWSRGFGTAGDDAAQRIAIDRDGNLVVGGVYAGALDLGGGPLPAPATGSNAFVVSLSPGDGSHRWSRSLGGGGISDVATAGGQIAIAGAFSDVTSVGGRTFAIVLDVASGSVLGARGVDGALAEGIALGDDGAVYVGGYFNVDVDFGDGAHQSVGTQDAFVVRLR